VAGAVNIRRIAMIGFGEAGSILGKTSSTPAARW